jgi:hypothetical protein
MQPAFLFRLRQAIRDFIELYPTWNLVRVSASR